MAKKILDNTKLGLFVVAGLIFLIFSLYMIGRNRNLFGPTFTIHASFHNVNGLVPGNNVRYAGIDVGTVKEIELRNDSSVFVTMLIEKKVRDYIHKNAVATIATDGLMGNKLININSQPGTSEPVEAGTVLRSLKPVETDEMLRTLNTTNDNIAIITQNLKEITRKLNNSNSLWNLLADTIMTRDLKQAVADIKRAGNNTVILTAEATDMIQRVKQGDGLVGALLTDTIVFAKLDESLVQVKEASRNAAVLTDDLRKLVQRIEQGEGTAGVLLSDTTWSHKLHQSITNIEEGTARFNENMEALKHNFLFRGYFRKQEKRQKKESKSDGVE